MKLKEITSESNPYFRTLESLLQSKGIKKEGLVLVSGKKIIPELLERLSKEGRMDEVENLIFSQTDEQEAVALSRSHSILQGVRLSSNLFKALDDSGTHFPLLALKLPALGEYQSPRKGLNVFLALSDPSNLGATLRSLKAFDCAQVILLKECANAFLPKVTKAASGFNLDLFMTRGPSIEDLNLENPLALDMKGQDLRSFSWPEISCLVLGEEGRGVPLNIKGNSTLIRIEMNSTVESLSAPIAVSIAAHSFYGFYLTRSKNN